MLETHRSLCMETPIAGQASNLRSLALQLRLSASQTEDINYIALFLCAAMALETHADTATLGLPHLSRL
jgi:hypothetical protein